MSVLPFLPRRQARYAPTAAAIATKPRMIRPITPPAVDAVDVRPPALHRPRRWQRARPARQLSADKGGGAVCPASTAPTTPPAGHDRPAGPAVDKGNRT